MSDPNTFHKLQQPYPDEKYSVYGLPEWAKEFGTASWSSEVRMDTIVCPVYPGHQRSGKRLGNLKVVLPSGRLGDFASVQLFCTA